MKLKKLDNQGIAHLFVLAILGVAVVAGGTGALVVKANHHKTAAAQKTTTSKFDAKTASSAQTTSGLATATPTTAASTTVSTTPSSPSSTKTKSTSTAAKTPSTTTTAKATTVQSTTSPTTPSTPAPTLLSTLTAIISNLDSGSAEAQVTASSVTVPGPITDAKARPIVFSFGGKTYFAYTQGSAPNFNTSASQTAGTMATVVATVTSPPLILAHLDKAGNLVDTNLTAVGYSTGGN